MGLLSICVNVWRKWPNERGEVMAKVRFYVRTHDESVVFATGEMDTVKDLGMEPGEWEKSSQHDKTTVVADWLLASLDYGWQEEPKIPGKGDINA